MNLNTTASFDAQGGNDDLAYMLRHLANLIDDGKVKHINQVAQLIVAGDQDDIDKIEELAKDAGSTINIRKT